MQYHNVLDCNTKNGNQIREEIDGQQMDGWMDGRMIEGMEDGCFNWWVGKC